MKIRNFFKIELNLNRIYGLDILRAVAIFIVVALHGGKLLTPGMSKIQRWLIEFDGVSIFFVLSGFLIGGILIKTLEKRQNEKNVLLNFWVKRWFRTLPNYFLILIVLLLLNALFTENFSLLHTWQLKYFIFSQNLFSEHPSFFPEAWSLSIEEWFYLLIPLILFTLRYACKLHSNQTVILTASGIIFLITSFRFYRYLNITVENLNQWDSIFRKQVITRLDSLMYGMIGAFIQFYYREKWLKNKGILFCFGVLILATTKMLASLGVISIGGLYNCVFSFSATSIATLFLLPYLSDLKKGSGVVYRIVTYVSLISYSMYLLNFSVIQGWIIYKIHWEALQEIIKSKYLVILTKYSLYWILTIGLSIITYKYFEIPIVNLRDNKMIRKWFISK